MGIAVDSSANVYVADLGNSRVEKFDSNGAFIAQWGSAGIGNGQFALLMGIALDSSGNVFVADSYNNRVQKFTSAGAFITTFGSIGNAAGQFALPVGLAVDVTGNVYVADTGNHRIQVFSADPVAPAAASGGGGGGGGGGCFIATAAFGSYCDPYVMILRLFRDRYLLPNGPGRYCVGWYYRVSPAIADIIKSSEAMKSLVRVMLFPVIGLAFLSLKIGVMPLTLIFLVFGAVVSATILRTLKHT
jgi:hypothetical protein